MAQRLELHEMLCDALGSENVYFQPPEGFKLSYPCIVYERQQIDDVYANNLPYMYHYQYDVTLIDRDPEGSGILEKLAELPLCAHRQHFVSDNLHHDVFTIYT